MSRFTRVQWKNAHVNHGQELKGMFSKFGLSKWGIIGFKRVNGDRALVRVYLSIIHPRKGTIPRQITARLYREGLPYHDNEDFFFGIDPEELIMELTR